MAYLARNWPEVSAYATIGRTIIHAPILASAQLHCRHQDAVVAHARGHVPAMSAAFHDMLASFDVLHSHV